VAHYVDTSAFVKLVVDEPHSGAFRTWAEKHEGDLFSSDLLVTEALRTARRHSTEALREARQALDVLTIVRLTPDIWGRAAELDPVALRTLDALHLAAALTAADELDGIATYDDRLAAAAEQHGIVVVAPADDHG
jgi:hypothetical protein